MSVPEHDVLPRVTSLAEDPGLPERLRRMWETSPGLYGWIATVDHKQIGLRYIVTAFVFLLLGGVEALIMRLQLAQGGERLLTPEQYDQLFSMHGITMIFLYALPVLSGFSNFLFPLVLGGRDMAFPRLNAFSYWVYIAAGLFMYASFLMGVAPDDGWFNYAPNALKPFSPGPNMDFYALGMILLGVSTTVGAVNFVITVLRMRAPGMIITRLPVLVWGTSTASAAILLAVPAVSLAFILLWLDRNFGTHFFSGSAGGQPLLWQHLFWIFAHPWVYIIVLPAMGLVSDALPILCRRPLVGYGPVVLATVVTMIVGFGVWAHHMFATGLPEIASSFFSSTSFIIALPSAVATFAWIATIWAGRPVFTTALLYFVGFIVMFVIGGVSGVVTASVPADLQLTDTYFVVAHLHYVLIGINLFGVLGALYFWFPKMTGRFLGERLGRWNFWVTFIGFNVAFLPMHLTGLMGMPRRVYTYPVDPGLDAVNLTSTLGSLLLGVGILLLVINVVLSLRQPRTAPANPWDAPTLEWAMSSPPPPYNFAVIPTIESRHPLWEDRLQPGGDRSVLDRGLALDRGKEALATTVLEARPDVVLKMPDDSPWPFALTVAMSVLFTALLLHGWWVGMASALVLFACVLGWLWPSRRLAQTAEPPNV
ncbi:MAG TPA: cytochrome c oxidase subunit I [Devosia sp.]|nr:cytochrome c oxidase subunit I [Devosia sp.]